MSRHSSSSDDTEILQPLCPVQETEYGDGDIPHASLLCRQENHLEQFQERYASPVVDEEDHSRLFFNQEYNFSQERLCRNEPPGGVFYSLHPSSDDSGSTRDPPNDVIQPSSYDNPSGLEEASGFSDLPLHLHGSYRGDTEYNLGGHSLTQRHDDGIMGEYDLHPSLLERYEDGFPPLEITRGPSENEANDSWTDETFRKTSQYETQVVVLEIQDDSDAETTAQVSVGTESSEASSESGSNVIESGQFSNNVSSFYRSIEANSNVMQVGPDVFPAEVSQPLQQNAPATFTSTGYQTASVEETNAVEREESMQTVAKSDDRQASLHSESTDAIADHLPLSPTILPRQSLVRQLSSPGESQQSQNEATENNEEENGHE